MAEMDEILKQAEALGRLIAAHSRVQAFAAAQAKLAGDKAAQSLLADYQRHAEHVHRLETEGKPIEVADKHKLRDLQTSMAGNEALKQLMRTQADYLELSSRVQDAMDAPLGEALSRAHGTGAATHSEA